MNTYLGGDEHNTQQNRVFREDGRTFMAFYHFAIFFAGMKLRVPLPRCLRQPAAAQDTGQLVHSILEPQGFPTSLKMDGWKFGDFQAFPM